MPIMKCEHNGKSGFKYGESGHCYTGKDAKKKAIKQGLAIEGPEKFASKASQEDIDVIMSDDELTLLEKVSVSLAFKNK